MDTKLFDRVCVSASILKMGIPIQYHAIMEHIMKSNKDSHNSMNAIDDLSHKFPMVEKFKVTKYDNEKLIVHDNYKKYYFYSKGEDILYIVSKEEEISTIIYNFLVCKDNDIEIKKQIVHRIILSLFEINVKVDDYDQETESYNITYKIKQTTYFYNFRILDKGYCSLTITDRTEENYGISEICNKIS